MEFKFKNIIIYFDKIIIFIFILSITSKEIFSIFACYLINYIFIFIHELSHCLVARIFNIKIKKINILLSGLFINLNSINNLNKYQRILIFLAGPLCNFILFLLLYNFKILASINLFLFGLNLLPLKNFDGYNILNEIFEDKILIFISNFIFITLLILNFLLVFNYNVYFLSIILLYYFIQNIKK